ncbi:MAG: ATP-binding protein [Methanomicrobiaceae archaeon]|nr:ATP-binding protein [Methanomicrobiaceae archaeon]
MSPQIHDDEVLEILELLITAEIVNHSPELNKDDLTPKIRGILGVNGSDLAIKRPVYISEGMIQREMGMPDPAGALRKNPFVSFEEFGKRLRITTLEPAAEHFLKRGGAGRVQENPVLAYFFETQGENSVSYRDVRARNSPYRDTKAYLDARLAEMLEADAEMRTARDLIIISAPEEIEYSLDHLVITPVQEALLTKIATALSNRDFLKERGIYEFGKLLFVGPPGTGKTSLALAMSRVLHMPILEVRLAMVTSQYLGETSKNIDRIFELAKRLSPCILFIDEFDFVAKSRVTEDNAAMKRAVNMLLKNIDMVSFIRNGVLLIGATNHPWLLDEAAWRRFDDVVEFPLPDTPMRREILGKVSSHFECECDFDDLAGETEGFSGADLRIMIKEAILNALVEGRQRIEQQDINRGMDIVKKRDRIRKNSLW